MGRKKMGNDKLLQVWMPLADYQKLEELARSQNTTVAEIVRRNIKPLVVMASSVLTSSNAA